MLKKKKKRNKSQKGIFDGGKRVAVGRRSLSLSLSLALLPHQFLCTLFHNNNNSEINRFTARNQLILVVCDD